ncbi:hypothetical protein [Helicobacter sp. 11S02629-2]|uniref:hypothetical protein n=1 Tax=Helicobacter sp. 11S02629-2 TaxID=1476195 RepID=UPI000BA4F212|nr:hypothetical protein [Helicobacter sp. 11S02629-2]PAF41389.1 hypothetical protein BKH40_08425 [Helicobacter sp. 11S02629-2]
MKNYYKEMLVVSKPIKFNNPLKAMIDWDCYEIDFYHKIDFIYIAKSLQFGVKFNEPDFFMDVEDFIDNLFNTLWGCFLERYLKFTPQNKAMFYGIFDSEYITSEFESLIYGLYDDCLKYKEAVQCVYLKKYFNANFFKDIVNFKTIQELENKQKSIFLYGFENFINWNALKDDEITSLNDLLNLHHRIKDNKYILTILQENFLYYVSLLNEKDIQGGEKLSKSLTLCLKKSIDDMQIYLIF